MDSQIAPHQHHQGVEGEEDGQQHEKKSVLKKVKAKAKKIKDNITKHGGHDHPHDYDDDEEEDDDDDDDEVLEDSVYEGAAMRSGVGGQAQHEDVGIGMPPPGPRETTSPPAAVTTLFTSVDKSADASNTTMSLSPSKLEEDPHAPKDKTHLHSPRNSEVKVHDPAGTGSEEAGESQIFDSFAKMKVNDEQNQSGNQVSYAQKISAVGSAVSGKAVAAKDFVASKIALTVTEKLKPGEEDKALSEVISGALNRRKQEVVKVGESAFRETPKGSVAESEKSSGAATGRSVVGMVKETVGSWLGKAGNQSAPSQQSLGTSEGVEGFVDSSSAGQGRRGKDHGGTEAEVRILQESAN